METELSTVVDSTYYYLSGLSVYGAGIFLILIFPLIMWRHYLKGKGVVYGFLFCIITQTCFLCNLVLLLGFFKIANRITLILGILVEYYVVWWKTCGKYRGKVQPLYYGRFGLNKIPDIFREIGRRTKHKILDFHVWIGKWKSFPVWRWTLKNWFSIIVLAAVVVYNALYLNHDVLTDTHSYQFSDISVHLSWVYELNKGNLFSSGIYPFYMHCMIFCIYRIFGLKLVEVTLYYGTFQTILMFLCMYCYARKLFCNKYIALIPEILLSLLLNQFRYTASLPQECGMFAVMCIGYFMMSYLQSECKPFFIEGDNGVKKVFRIKQYFFRLSFNRDLILLALSVALVIGYHFYTAIVAFILVLSFAVSYLPRVMRKERFVPLLSAGFLGLFIAVLPFIACFAKGMKFQGSMNWAMSVINGSIESNTEEQKEVAISFGKILSGLPSLWKSSASYGIMNNENLSVFIVICILLPLTFIVVSFALKSYRESSLGYIHLSIYYVIMWILKEAKYFGFPVIIEQGRVPVFTIPFMMFILTVPIDLLFRTFEFIPIKGMKKVNFLLSGIACILSGGYIISNGYVHDYLSDNYPGYYNEDDYVIRNIVDEFPKNSYTVVSPTSDYYLIIDNGYHTELSEFVNMLDGGEDEFVFPSEYVFFFVEKKALRDSTYGSSFVEPKYAEMDYDYTGKEIDYLHNRLIIESKAYYWAQEMMKIYPDSFSVYFEDDIFAVYLLKQNVNYPVRLKLDYQNDAENIGILTTETESVS